MLEAQPPSAAHSTTIPRFRIFGCFPAGEILSATSGGEQGTSTFKVIVDVLRNNFNDLYVDFRPEKGMMELRPIPGVSGKG